MKKLILFILISSIPLFILAQSGLNNNIKLTSNNAFTFGYSGIYTDPLKKFNLSTPGSLVTVGATGSCIYSGIDFGAPGGYLFGLHKYSVSACDLFRIDTANASSILISTHNYTGTLACMTFDPQTWSHYILTSDSPNKIFTFNIIVPGDLLLAAQLPAQYYISSISINNSGSMYGIDELNDNLVKINKVNGTVTNIGTLGFNASGISGCDFDPLTGRLYIIIPGAANPELRWIDTLTGTATSSGSMLGNVKNLAIAGNTFTTPPMPPAPILIYPSGTINTLTPLMDWSDAQRASLYHVQVMSGAIVIIDRYTAQSQYQVPSGYLAFNQSYYWRVYGINGAGTGPSSSLGSFTCTIADINKIGNEIPGMFSLFQNYPNPFNPVAKIKFSIPENANRKNENCIVTLKVYDILGKEIETLVNESLQSGTYEVTFDGSALNSGIYFYKISIGDFSVTKKMVLIK